MSSLTRAINNSCSATTFNCVKSIHVLAKRASQLDVSRKNADEFGTQSETSARVPLIPESFIKHPACFCMHPEKLKQIIREKDGEILCNFLSKDGYMKRKKCLLYMEKRRRLLQSAGNRPYVIRDLCTLVRKPDTPSSYTSYINSQIRANPNAPKSSVSHQDDRTSAVRSEEVVASQETKEIFMNLNNPFKKKTPPEEKIGRKKKLKPIQSFKRTNTLSESSEMCLPPEFCSEADYGWASHYDLRQAAKNDVADVRPKERHRRSRDPVPKVLTSQRKTLKMSIRDDIPDGCEDEASSEHAFVRNVYRAKQRASLKEDDIPDGCEDEASSEHAFIRNKALINNVFTLFDRVKLGSRNRKIREGTEISVKVSESTQTDASHADPHDTYKIVDNTLRRKEINLKKQFREMSLCTQTKNKKHGKSVTELIGRVRTPVDFTSIPQAFEKHIYTTSLRHRNYLIRLPKTTREGYRVLLYAVRDNDPTKMNFSDCVKGFCMYNDCILSEDGLQEGYIVVFDMKGVQLGHLARVSLPALRCFMLYIQEAHPCRLKAIHILNTASWIHHVMRLVIPLVRSDLLNLVQFHKGNIPDGFQLGIMPADYGGEAPSVEQLDNETKSMVEKYHEWLVESAEWKSDESKRVKKPSWWGFFNGSNKAADNVELDEKTILKNLQID